MHVLPTEATWNQPNPTSAPDAKVRSSKHAQVKHTPASAAGPGPRCSEHSAWWSRSAHSAQVLNSTRKLRPGWGKETCPGLLATAGADLEPRVAKCRFGIADPHRVTTPGLPYLFFPACAKGHRPLALCLPNNSPSNGKRSRQAELPGTAL